jgi:hypothetical protein
MPYFDWKSSGGVALKVVDHERFETELQVTLSEERLNDFHHVLSAVMVQAEAELRIDFPGKWTVYWKARDGESRILLAHPEAEEWVGTVAWAHSSTESLLRELAALRDGAGEVNLGELDRLSRFSNLTIRIQKG